MSNPTARRRTLAHLAPALALVTALGGTLHAADLVVPSQDFATIQSAVDAAQAGDRIVILPGTYQEAVLISEMSSLELVGKKGATIDGGGTSEPLTVSFSDGIRIEGLRVTGAAGFGLVLNNTTDSVVERVSASNATNSGIHVNGGSGVLVTRCRVEDCFNGISMTNGQANVATGNRIRDVTNDGFFTYGAGHVIAGNRVTGADDNAVQVGNNNAATGILVEGNRFSDLGGPAILFGSAASACVLRDNAITGGTHGVLLDSGASAITLTGNRLVKPSATGVQARSDASLTATGNRFLRPGQHGVRLESDAGECLFVDNRIVKPTLSGVWVQVDAEPSRFVGNTVIGAGAAGFALDGDGCSLVLNRASKSATFDLEVGGEDTVLVENAFGTSAP